MGDFIFCNMLISTLFLALLVAAATAVDKKSKHPKLFFVSSSSTTTTLSTTTLCYSTATTLTTCGRRKKRAIFSDPDTGEQGSIDLADLIAPQAPLSDADEEVSVARNDELIKSGEGEYKSDGEFLLYWKTTTSTSTFTTYTSTTTLGGLECTPSNFGISQCPSNGKKYLAIFVIVATY